MNRTIPSTEKNKRKSVFGTVLMITIFLSSYFSNPLVGKATENTLINQQKKPEEYLFFQSIPDGKCQTLSDGGQLRLIFSRHPSKAINFRLIRFFADKKQGLSQGIIYPDSDGYRLGCSIVDGRRQVWYLERAIFASDYDAKAK